MFCGWEGLSQYEIKMLDALKSSLEGIELPQGFDDRELLKFLAGQEFNLDKTK